MTTARTAWRLFRLSLHIVLGVILTPIVAQRDPVTGKRRTNLYVAAWWHGRVAKILNLAISTHGYPPAAPALLVSNHVSWLDVIVLGHLVPTAFLSKDEVRAWPVIGWLADMAGTLFIKRGSGQATLISEAIRARLTQNGMLTLFPEGTTTDGRDVRPFFSRLFGAAIDSGSKVVPVTIRYHQNGEYDPIAPYINNDSLMNNLMGLLRRRDNAVHIVFSEPMHIGNESRKELAEQARKTIADAIRMPIDGHAEVPDVNSNLS